MKKNSKRPKQNVSSGIVRFPSKYHGKRFWVWDNILGKPFSINNDNDAELFFGKYYGIRIKKRDRKRV